MRRAAALLFTSILAGVSLLSCGGYSSPSNKNTGSGLKFRALVSQAISTSIAAPGLFIVNANTDARAPVAPISAGNNPGMMVLSDNRQFTLAFSSNGNTVNIVSNASEAAAASATLPGPTQSIVVSPDSNTGYAAVPTAPITAGVPGGIVVFAVTSTTTGAGTITATIPVPNAHYLARSGDGSRLLAFSDNCDAVTVVAPFSVTPGQTVPINACDPTAVAPYLKVVPGFDRPVFGFLSSDGTQAWILNCGPECGGTQASVQMLDLVHNVAGARVLVEGATVGFVNNQTLYVAGTPASPGNTCAGVTTAATSCGRLSIIDMPSLTLTGTAVIADGYHTQMQLGSNGQLFIGSRNCTNIVPPPAPATGEQRGCLSIFNTTNNSVVAPPDNGDVTGLAPITNRTIMYVIENGELRIYDTTTDKISTQNNNASIDFIGQAVDVKLIDF